MRPPEYAGRDEAYIQHLESTVNNLRCENKSLQVQLQHSPPNHWHSLKPPRYGVIQLDSTALPAVSPPPKVQQWERDKRTLISSFSDNPERWNAARTKFELDTVVQNNRAIGMLTSDPVLTDTPSEGWQELQKTINSPASGIVRAKAYDSQTVLLAGTAKQHKLLSAFREVVLVSWICVQVKAGDATAVEADNAMMDMMFGSTSSQHMRDFRRAAVWVNKCCSDLLGSPWAERCYEGFLKSTFPFDMESWSVTNTSRWTAHVRIPTSSGTVRQLWQCDIGYS
jgi:hypothetical protein